MHNERYKSEYTPDFASRWDDLIGWEGREKAEGGFFEKLLEKHGCKSVADVATGTGYHAITLAKNGFDVVATDGADTMVDQTRVNAEQYNVKLRAIDKVEWADLATKYGKNAFDSVLCLGNAFTHLFQHEARVASLQAMFDVVRPGGVCVIDHRNYDDLLDNGFSTKHQYYYTGNGVDARPVEITPESVYFEYSYPDGEKYHLTMYPLRVKYVEDLLRQVGFDNVTQYGDFKQPYDPAEPDFIQQVAIKPKG